MRQWLAAVLIPATSCSVFLGDAEPGDNMSSRVELGAPVLGESEDTNSITWSHVTTTGDPLTLLVAAAARTPTGGLALFVDEAPGPSPLCLFDNGAVAAAHVNVGVWLVSLQPDSNAVELRVEGDLGVWVGSSSTVTPSTVTRTSSFAARGEANEQLSLQVDSSPDELVVGVFGWGASFDVNFELLEPHHLVSRSALGVDNDGVSLAIFAVDADSEITVVEPSDNDVARRWAGCAEVLASSE